MQALTQENLQFVVLFKKKPTVLPSANDKAGNMADEKGRRAGGERGKEQAAEGGRGQTRGAMDES